MNAIVAGCCNAKFLILPLVARSDSSQSQSSQSQSPQSQSSQIPPPSQSQSSQQNGSKEFIDGSIIRIKLFNFVTYDQVELFPEPGLNLIVGPNGTGLAQRSFVRCPLKLPVLFAVRYYLAGLEVS